MMTPHSTRPCPDCDGTGRELFPNPFEPDPEPDCPRCQGVGRLPMSHVAGGRPATPSGPDIAVHGGTLSVTARNVRVELRFTPDGGLCVAVNGFTATREAEWEECPLLSAALPGQDIQAALSAAICGK